MKGPIKRRRSNRSIDERMLRESFACDLENDLLSLTMRLTRTLTRYGNNDYSRSERNVETDQRERATVLRSDCILLK